ncbi:hypothetical protein IM42_00645 [Fervidobacterium sp. SC_NGM5_O18]|jgi:hypothetical protein|nr:DUF4911 domain-containing protein [Fervidobacterium pennivorans]ANE42259.1 hypothetical protein JM64_04720 [Fervidobacterium pennivorans]MDM7321189.1 DUF4911 domain-containing protein [Fervidobacterium sp.]PHJ13397.1 hypothetical protein IM42_00645 [Fervidobacterium sp. SC_NGM5_O18]
MKDDKLNVQEPVEYDILVKIKKEDVHILNYLLEAEDNVMNIRSFEGEYLKVIATKDTVVDAIRLLENVRSLVDLEIVALKPNNGSAG